MVECEKNTHVSILYIFFINHQFRPTVKHEFKHSRMMSVHYELRRKCVVKLMQEVMSFVLQHHFLADFITHLCL